MRGIHHLHALHHLSLRADLHGLFGKLKQDIVVLGVTRMAGELNHQGIGVEQHARFERIQQQPGGGDAFRRGAVRHCRIIALETPGQGTGPAAEMTRAEFGSAWILIHNGAAPRLIRLFGSGTPKRRAGRYFEIMS